MHGVIFIDYHFNFRLSLCRRIAVFLTSYFKSLWCDDCTKYNNMLIDVLRPLFAKIWLFIYGISNTPSFLAFQNNPPNIINHRNFFILNFRLAFYSSDWHCKLHGNTKVRKSTQWPRPLSTTLNLFTFLRVSAWSLPAFVL